MDILINVSKQRLKLATNLKKYVSGSQEFVRFVFGLNSYWRDLLTFAQFAQNGNTYNRYLDDENAVYLPSEIVAGECTLTLFGSGNSVIATTNYLTLTIDENILVSDASSTDISESLYEQLVDMVRSVSNGTAVVDAKNKMIDKNKIYVYIGSETGMTNGNWYYWNGTAWTSGGVWNAVAVETDKTLSVENKAADGKAAGSLVEVGNTQPTSTANKIWINPTDEEIEIPEMGDLNAVDAKVDNLKSDLGYKYIENLNDETLFEHGSIGQNGVNDSYNSGARIRTPILYAGCDITVAYTSTQSTARLIVFFFDSSGRYTGRYPTSGWSNRCVIPNGTTFRILMTANTDSSEEISISEILASFVLYNMVSYNNGYVQATIYDNGQYYFLQRKTRWSSAEIRENPYDMRITANGGKFGRLYYNHSGEVSNYISGFVTEAIIPKNTPYKLILTVDDNNEYTLEETLSHFTFDVAEFCEIAYLVENNNIISVFEHGSLDNGANDTYNENARVRTRSIVSCVKDLHIKYISGQYQIHYFNDENVFYERTGWLTIDRVIKSGTKFRLLVTESPSFSALAPISEILEGINVRIVNTKAAGLNPNIIYQCRNVDQSAIPPESKWYVQAAAENQYDRIRFTFKRTTDGYWFCCHDANINGLARNPDGSVIDEPIPAEGQTLATLNSYDWGIQYGLKYAGAKVPMLEDGFKYASIYNLGVTIHYSNNLDYVGDNYITEVIEMADKYGILDNAIVLSGNGKAISKLQAFKQHNPRTSYYIGGEESWFTAENIESIKTLQTPYNKIYVQLYPWGTVATDTFRELARQNNFVLYDSITMNRDTLLDVDMFNKGYGVREVANVYMIKDTIREWVNSLIDADDI